VTLGQSRESARLRRRDGRSRRKRPNDKFAARVEVGLIAGTIHFILGNFTFTFLVIGLIASGISLLRAPKPHTAPLIVDALFSYFLLFSIASVCCTTSCCIPSSET
jgi:hypothetical protein